MDCSTKNEYQYSMSVPSLRRTVIVYIVTSLWKQRDIREAIKNSTDTRDNYFKCAYLEEYIIKKLSQLRLPDTVIRELSDIVRPMRVNMMKFIDEKKYDFIHFHNSIDHVDSFRWDSDGIIDKVQTLRIQLENQRIDDAYYVYAIACEYCLEDVIIDVWLKIAKHKRSQCLTFNRNPFVIYWTHITRTGDRMLLNRRLSQTFSALCNTDHGLFVNMVAISMWKANLIAVKYFWHKLSIDEIAYHAVMWAEKTVKYAHRVFRPNYKTTCEYTDILVFFLSKLTDQQVRTILQKYPEVPKLLLYNWPWQSLFLPTIDKMWTFMDGEIYAKLLMFVTIGTGNGSIKEAILKVLWHRRSKKHLNRYVVQNILDGGRCKNMLAMWMNNWHIRSMQLVLSCANTMEKKQLLSTIFRSEYMHDNTAYELLTSKLHLFKILVSPNSDHEIDEYKKDVITGRNWWNLLSYFIKHNNWQEFERLFMHSNALKGNSNFQNVRDAVTVVYQLITHGYYLEIDKLLKWCNLSKKGEILLKNELIVNFNTEIVVSMGCLGWRPFRQFFYHFLRSEELNSLRLQICHYNAMERIVARIIQKVNNVEFVEKFVIWCTQCNYELTVFKRKFSRSQTGQELFNNFLLNCDELIGSEEVERFVKFYHPFEREVIMAYKESNERERDMPCGLAARNIPKTIVDLLESYCESPDTLCKIPEHMYSFADSSDSDESS